MTEEKEDHIHIESEKSDDDEPQFNSVRPNKFADAFLDAQNDSENDGENDDGGIKNENVDTECTSSSAVAYGNTRINGKKKRRNKKKAKTNREEGDEEEDLDEIVRQMDASMTMEQKQQQHSSESTALESLLKVDVRTLDPDAELRRLLGRTFGAEQQRAGGGGPKQQRRQQQQPTWGRLVKSRMDWPAPRQLGFHMAVEKESPANGDGVRFYRFRHNEQYQNQQQLFWLYQRQMDHEGILNDVLPQNPYHLDSLLLLCEILSVQEDIQRARDTIERGIFACESVFHSSFQPLSPFHRLDYGWRENRAFFLLLHRHMLHQLQRRCFQTALQFGKMIFGKDPDGDPLGLLLIVDILALKGRSPDFLLEFYAFYRQKRLLDMLPNFLFSLPLAHLALAEKEQNAKIKADKEKEAEKCLEEAFVRFPTVLSQLLDRLQVQPDAAIERNYYLNALFFYREPDGARLLVQIYVHHSAEELWRPRLSWLEQTTHRVLQRLQNRHAELDEWAQKRKRSFVGLPPNIARHCTLHGIRPNDAALTHLLDQFVGSDAITDPCPPRETKQDYTAADLDQLFQMHGINNVQPAEAAQEAVGGMLGTFLRTLLPEQEQDRFDAIVQAVRHRVGLGGTNTTNTERENNDNNGAENGEENRPTNDENRRQGE